MGRDRIQRGALEAEGWSVWQVWEHDLAKRTLPDLRLSLGLSLQRLAAERRHDRYAVPR